MKDSKLSIIIVTFESSAVIRSCLEKINFKKYNVFVVDNNSQDETTKIIQDNFPKVNLIKLNQNIGYGRANNAALQKVKTDYALILNPDAFIFEQDIDVIIKSMDKNDDYALGAPLLLENYPKQDVDIKRQKEIVLKNLITKIDKNYSVKYVIGAIVFLKMSIFNKIGFYDNDTFMFYEDDEICYRVVKNNYKCIIFSNNYGFHIGGGSSNKTFRNIYKRNLHMYLSKLRWKRKRVGYLTALKSSLRLMILNIILGLFNLLFNHQKLAKNLGFISGIFCFLFNLKPFKKNGEARG